MAAEKKKNAGKSKSKSKSKSPAGQGKRPPALPFKADQIPARAGPLEPKER